MSFTFTPSNYESDGVLGGWAVTGRNLTGISDGVGQGHRDRTYAEIGILDTIDVLEMDSLLISLMN